LRAISGVIGDTNNPEVPVAMSGSTNTAGDWRWVVTSTNQTVLPNDKITVLLCEHGALVKLAPVGVGYSELSITVSDGVISNSVLVQYAASSSSRAATAWHLAASDGSTAILLDGDVMLIGDDENQGIRLYPRSRSSLPLKQYDFTSNLELPDLGAGMPREVDIEASTRVANRIFWIGSHGHSSFGEIRTNRTRIFATDLHETGDSTTLSYVGRYDYLKFDLLRWDSLNLHRKGTNFYGIEASDAEGVPPKAPDGSGFAIEGLAFSTTDTNTAWVGFRAPIVPPGRRTRTLLVPVTNFYDLVSTGGPPGSSEFGDPVVLDLGGRGIRSIEGNGGGYLIVAGPPGVGASDLPEDFKIFTWSGDAEHAAVERTADLRGLNPEGIIALPPAPWTERSVVGLLSDCGTVEYYGDGLSAKLLSTKNFKKCRSDWLEIGGVVSAYYLTTTIAVGQGVVHVEWRAQPGLTYVVEICDSLAALEWRPAIGPIVADRQLGRVELAIEGRQRFVRVRRVE
jgi:hypothetical protein